MPEYLLMTSDPFLAGFEIIIIIALIWGAISKIIESVRGEETETEAGESDTLTPAERLKQLQRQRKQKQRTENVERSAYDREILEKKHQLEQRRAQRREQLQNRDERKAHPSEQRRRPKPMVGVPDVPDVFQDFEYIEPEVKSPTRRPTKSGRAVEVVKTPMVHKADAMMAASSSNVTRNIAPKSEVTTDLTSNVKHYNFGLLNKKSLREAIVMKEILDPPLALRDGGMKNRWDT